MNSHCPQEGRMLKINLMIQEDSVGSFMCYTAVYNLELAKRA